MENLLDQQPTSPLRSPVKVIDQPNSGVNGMAFDVKQLGDKPDAIAPDGSEVRLLCSLSRGSMAHFTLAPGAVSIAVAHRTIEEIWFFESGRGRMWRQLDGEEETVEVGRGSSISIPVGAHFQFRCDSSESLKAVGVAMPPWPGDDEAYTVDGPWTPSV
ncbi:MAG: cupin domain-containing protein [Pseudomonadota bacterium]